MLKTEILNAPLLSALATLGHTDTVVIADCGLPLPVDATVVDLALVRGRLGFEEVLKVLTENLEIEASTLASEASGGPVEQWVAGYGLDPRYISHEQLKAELPQAKLIVRTGETTAYANIILHCGVAF
ncbi:D-ribose pyranase [Glutamicibacter creatinolyticus]|uniref:D-ribose pyranase n=1 Tax=Glutamicibacter creatinolyticus TaxID=162496 RepID=UPI0037C091DF